MPAIGPRGIHSQSDDEFVRSQLDASVGSKEINILTKSLRHLRQFENAKIEEGQEGEVVRCLARGKAGAECLLRRWGLISNASFPMYTSGFST
jgi:hypothetical protein